MSKRIVGTIIDVALSCSLLLGGESLHQFAFYVMCAMTSLAWLALFLGGARGEAAVEIRSRLWISLPSSAFSLYAMIATGHTVLAAASFLVTFFILIVVFHKPGGAA